VSLVIMMMMIHAHELSPDPDSLIHFETKHGPLTQILTYSLAGVPSGLRVIVRLSIEACRVKRLG
jgi:hypothetical protein